MQLPVLLPQLMHVPQELSAQQWPSTQLPLRH